jgi:hypothetical protein
VEQWYADTTGHEDGVTIPGDANAHTVTRSSNSVHDRTGSSGEGETLLQAPNEFQAIHSTNAEGITALATADPAETRPASSTAVADAKMTVTDVEVGSMDELDDIMNELDELDDIDDIGTDDGYEFAEANNLDGSASESGESSYHDSVQAQVSHEDREDAFDYEHFFLHSAMGSMSRRRMRRRGSNDSFSSEDSVETTRGPVTSHSLDVAAAKIGRRSRRGSAGSTSTLESFATATEGRHTRTGIIVFDEYADEYPEQMITLPERARTHTPETAKRMVFSPDTSGSSSDPSRSQSSLPRRPQSSAAAFQHQASGSTGTSRSFPLIKKANVNGGSSTPDSSFHSELKHISKTLMNETASICDKESLHDGEKAAPMQMLQRDDQILVERLVASLGRCVLGLTEAGRASAEGRAYRRKIETARRILEGYE